jgi:hypothetical protein
LQNWYRMSRMWMKYIEGKGKVQRCNSHATRFCNACTVSWWNPPFFTVPWVRYFQLIDSRYQISVHIHVLNQVAVMYCGKLLQSIATRTYFWHMHPCHFKLNWMVKIAVLKCPRGQKKAEQLKTHT